MTFAACAGPAPRSFKASSTDCFGDAELMDLPEWANEALDNLGKIYAMTRGIIDLLERESASEGDLRGNSQGRWELSHIAEKGTARSDACLQARPPTDPFHYRRGQTHRPLKEVSRAAGSSSHQGDVPEVASLRC